MYFCSFRVLSGAPTYVLLGLFLPLFDGIPQFLYSHATNINNIIGLFESKWMMSVDGVRPIGSDYILRFQIKLRMRKIKADDLLIKQEGNIASLDVSDLQNLVRERGYYCYTLISVVHLYL